MYRLYIDRSIRLVTPFGNIQSQVPDQFVCLCHVDVMQWDADFKIADTLDVIILLHAGTHFREIDYFGYRCRFRLLGNDFGMTPSGKGRELNVPPMAPANARSKFFND